MFRRSNLTSSEYDTLNKRFIDLMTEVKQLEATIDAMETKVKTVQKKMNKKIFPDLDQSEEDTTNVLVPIK